MGKQRRLIERLACDVANMTFAKCGSRGVGREEHLEPVRESTEVQVAVATVGQSITSGLSNVTWPELTCIKTNRKRNSKSEESESGHMIPRELRRVYKHPTCH